MVVIKQSKKLNKRACGKIKTTTLLLLNVYCLSYYMHHHIFYFYI